MVHLINGQTKYKVAALAQMEALFDPMRWPEWTDLVHDRFGRATLRTGMLAQDVAVAYDWLYQSLSVAERASIVEGLNRRGIQPYLETLAQDPWWTHDLNNWMTVIVGGFGIVGMVLGDEHPASERMVALALEKMELYLQTYGQEGEFNESVGYGSANRLAVNFYQAHRYWSNGTKNRLSEAPFPQMCEWGVRVSLPPGRDAGLGDAKPERALRTGYMGSVAAATGDGVLQDYFQQYHADTVDPYQVVSCRPGLAAVSPEGRWPRFKAYAEHGKIVVSRSDWDPRRAACIVYGKAGREKHHAHSDVGQVCIDGYGERLIVDLGSPSAYPADYFDEGRHAYYNASVIGHNVLTFDLAEQAFPVRQRGEEVDMELYCGRFLSYRDAGDLGAAWRMDLTRAYPGTERVRRTVWHGLPGYVAVLDEAEAGRRCDIALRWHLAEASEWSADGRFAVRRKEGAVSGWVMALDPEAPVKIRLGTHSYATPYDRSSTGEPLEQRREPYIEAVMQAERCRWLTLFHVQPAREKRVTWEGGPGRWLCGEASFELTAAGGSMVIGGCQLTPD
ncbi:MAG: heparinase II/III family protein [Opitutaceae bacterium]|nr:heparinase II/III family protein [Opitutaceae bacterium]